MQPTNLTQRLIVRINLEQRPTHAGHILAGIINDTRVIELVGDVLQQLPLHNANHLCNVLATGSGCKQPRQRWPDACARTTRLSLCRCSLLVNP